MVLNCDTKMHALLPPEAVRVSWDLDEQQTNASITRVLSAAL